MRKNLVYLLCVILVLFLAGCGKPTNENKPSHYQYKIIETILTPPVVFGTITVRTSDTMIHMGNPGDIISSASSTINLEAGTKETIYIIPRNMCVRVDSYSITLAGRSLSWNWNGLHGDSNLGWTLSSMQSNQFLYFLVE